ncbi:hypothetical protein RRG08_034092 [Elysia crispata]|uniref:Uncharacterized protein n=1 Tax=Elysia crispata TaxID=231223 RepID=A0AAE1D3Y9_9GAST|nr:hypothetical protein RRG08_034092 [Elysia crispata]
MDFSLNQHTCVKVCTLLFPGELVLLPSSVPGWLAKRLLGRLHLHRKLDTGHTRTGHFRPVNHCLWPPRASFSARSGSRAGITNKGN